MGPQISLVGLRKLHLEPVEKTKALKSRQSHMKICEQPTLAVLLGRRLVPICAEDMIDGPSRKGMTSKSE